MSINDLGLDLSDETLLKHLLMRERAEKEHAWGYVYKTNYPIVKDFVLKNSGSESDAIDIFQDGLMILHKNLNNGVFREEASIKTYVFKICRNLWFKELQMRQKQLSSMNDIAYYFRVPEVNYLISVEIVTLLMNEMKEECRSILTEYYYNNRSMAELKEMFNVGSIQAAKNKKSRCMGYLVKLCKERGITPALLN